MKINNIILIFTISFAVIFSCNPVQDSSTFSISRQGKMYVVTNNISHSTQKKTESFNEAFNYVTGKLKDRGGKLHLHSGKYEVKAPLQLVSNIYVVGDGVSSVLYVSDNFTGGNVVIVADTLNDVTLSNFTIRQKNNIENLTGVDFNHCGTSKMVGLSVFGLTGNGVSLTNSTFLSEIHGCKIGGIGKSGILLSGLDKGRGGDWIPGLISNNIVYDCERGVELNRSLCINIVNNVVYQPRQEAFYLYRSNSNLIAGCRAMHTGGVAVKAVSSHELNVSSNVFCWTEKEGILLDDIAWATITANEIIDNGSYNPMDSINMKLNFDGKTRPFRLKASQEQIENVGYYSGVKLLNKCRGVVVSSNAIFNWPAAHKMKYGIEEDETCYDNVFNANNINFAKEGDVLSLGENSRKIGNVAHLPVPHAGDMSILKEGNRMMQGWDERLMDYYINKQLK
jgi:hypothetical protein